MLRKNQVNTQATPDRIGLADSRITATITPSTTPKTMAHTVTRIVPLSRPSMTGLWFIALKTKCQSKALLVRTRCSSIAASTAMTAMATHRP